MKPASIICTASWLSFLAVVWLMVLHSDAISQPMVALAIFGVIGAFSGTMSISPPKPPATKL